MTVEYVRGAFDQLPPELICYHTYESHHDVTKCFVMPAGETLTIKVSINEFLQCSIDMKLMLIEQGHLVGDLPTDWVKKPDSIQYTGGDTYSVNGIQGALLKVFYRFTSIYEGYVLRDRVRILTEMVKFAGVIGGRVRHTELDTFISKSSPYDLSVLFVCSGKLYEAGLSLIVSFNVDLLSRKIELQVNANVEPGSRYQSLFKNWLPGIREVVSSDMHVHDDRIGSPMMRIAVDTLNFVELRGILLDSVHYIMSGMVDAVVAIDNLHSEHEEEQGG